MFGLVHGAVVVVCVSILAVVGVGVIIWRWNCYKKNRQSVDNVTVNARGGDQTLQAGIAKLHHPDGVVHHHHQAAAAAGVESKRSLAGNNYYRRGVSGKPLFSWANNPTFITDAVENGWSRFGFASYMSSPSTRSRLLGLCAAGDQRVRETEPEISWEVSQGSADFMQKIRLNSGLKKALSVSNSSSTAAASVIKTALPLPGPALGSNCFPQEAYFEITILYARGDEASESNGKVKEGEKTKLIQESYDENPSSDSLVHVTSSQRMNKIEELKLSVKDDHHYHHGKSEAVFLSLGLTVGGALPLKLPGSYLGSIGFSSNGSVHLDGNLNFPYLFH